MTRLTDLGRAKRELARRERAARAALAMEAAKPTRRETGSARKGDSAVGDSRNAQGTPHE